MPEISRFFGISIRMYLDDHNPPHFHAAYSGDEVTFDIESLVVLEGRISRRASGLIQEWAALHRQELLENWNRLHNEQTAFRIEPLH